LLLGCPAPAPPAASGGAQATATTIHVVPADGDVWGWTLRVEVVADGLGGGRSTADGLGGGRSTADGAAAGACHLVADGRRVELSGDGGTPSAELSLAEGPNDVFAECAHGTAPPVRSETVRYVERLPDAPRVRLVESADANGRVVLDASASRPSERSGAPIVDYVWWLEQGGARAAALGTGPTLALDSSRAAIHVSVRDAHGRAADAAVWGAGEPRSAWLDRAVVYGVLPPMFGAPPLRAVTSSLARLADLGVNVVWITPVFEAAPNDFGYAVTDYLRVRRDYGDEADLSALVSEAHRLGVRVLLDLPMNDTSSLHPYFVDASRRGATSRYAHFYARDASGSFTHYFDWNNLPNLDFEDPEATRWMLYSGARWLEQFAVDGYRVDAAWGIRSRSPAFLEAWARAMRDAKPGALLVAEGSARDPFYVEHGFDAAYDWTDQVGQWAWQDLFDGPGVAGRIARVLADPVYGARGRVLHFLENNDTGARFVTRHGLGATRVAAALLLTSPGVPCLFTGQEAGVAYEPYASPAAPVAELPSHAAALTEWYRGLIRIRREHPWLARASLRVLDARGSDDVVAYAASEGAPSTAKEGLVVVLNWAERPARVSVALTGALGDRAVLRDALGGSSVRTHHRTIDVDLPAWGVAILR
jgi:glycosidase